MLLRLVRVVRAAAQLDVRRCRRTAFRERDDMVKFEEGLLSTATQCADEGAPAGVALPDLAFHRCGDVARITHSV